MRHTLPQQVNNGRFSTQIFESIQGLLIKVMYPRTAENQHNTFAGTNCLVSLTLRDVNSKDINIINNVPLLRLLQLNAWRKGYFIFSVQEDDFQGSPAVAQIDNLGLTGVIRISEEGSIKLTAGMQLLLEISDIPTGSYVAVNTVENPLMSNQIKVVQKRMVNTEEPNHIVRLNDEFDTILISCSDSIERKYTHPHNSYNNPMEYLRLRDTDNNAPDSKLTWEDIRALNVIEKGNDIIAIYGWNEIDKYPRMNSSAHRTNWFNQQNSIVGTGAEKVPIYNGYYDWGCIDLENVDIMEIIRLGNTNDEIPYYLERTETI